MQQSSVDSSGTEAKGHRRFGWVAVPLTIFAGMALLFGYALQMGDPTKLPSALIGKPVPQFALGPIDGLTEDGKSMPGFDSAILAKGEVSVVNFWASWCIPCVQEHPLLNQLKQRTGANVYGVNYKDQAAAARRFLGLHGNPYTAVGADGNGRTAIEWGVYGMPETFIVDGRGRIVYKHVGPISPDALEASIIPAIAEARRATAKS